MTCLGWPFTTSVNRLACCGGQGDHIDEGHDVLTRRGKSSGRREERTIYPPSPLKQKQRILDVKSRQPQPIQLQRIFVCQLTSQMPMCAPSWVCMMLRVPSSTQTTTGRWLINSFALQPFLHNCNLLYCKVGSVSTVVHWLVGPCSGLESASLPSCLYIAFICHSFVALVC